MHVPDDWTTIDVEAWRGVVLCVGDADTGKTTFLRHAYERLRAAGRQVAVLDGDPGQSTLGLPATLTCTLSGDAVAFPPDGPSWSTFVGATSPRRHMLEMVVGARRLFDAAAAEGAGVLLYDTTGLVSVRHGGRALKQALLDLLQPRTVVALQRSNELEPILGSLRPSERHDVVEAPVSPAVSRRSTDVRKRHRAERFERAFAPAGTHALSWTDVAVRPSPDVVANHLVALEDAHGYVRALARVAAINRDARRLVLHTPDPAPASADTLRLGDLQLDPDTYRDHPID